MKKFKADEMEMAINFKAMRIAWIFSELTLAIYCIIDLVMDENLPFIPFLVLCISGILFLTSKLIMTKQMTLGGDYDEE